MKTPLVLIAWISAMVVMATVAVFFSSEEISEPPVAVVITGPAPPPRVEPEPAEKQAEKPAPAGPKTLFTKKYDAEIKRSVDRYWPDYPAWKAWKAQLFQESRLNPDAVSPVGARGLAQFMPRTWEEVSRELGMIGISPNSDLAIEAGAYYMMKLRRIWSSPRPADERQKLAQASYNAGAGNILKSQRICAGAVLWDDIAPCLKAVTGPSNSHETRTYVERISRWRIALEVQ